MSFYCGARTCHVYGWVFIVWFTSAVNVAGIELKTISQVVARCGENVILPCETPMPEVISLNWVTVNKSSQNAQLQDKQCESTAKTPKCSRNLTLLNMMPVNQGVYLCKLHSKHGVKSAKTVVTVQDCFEDPGFSINKSHAKCCFSGVYPSGIIHWLQEDFNFTDSANTPEGADQYGRYNVCSTIDIQKGNLSQPYSCSLWIPSVGKYYSSKELPMVNASGIMAKLQGLFVMVEIMMMRFNSL